MIHVMTASTRARSNVSSRLRAAIIESVDIHFKFAALLPIAIVTIVVANRSLLR
jgi:hypothetical protein